MNFRRLQLERSRLCRMRAEIRSLMIARQFEDAHRLGLRATSLAKLLNVDDGRRS